MKYFSSYTQKFKCTINCITPKLSRNKKIIASKNTKKIFCSKKIFVCKFSMELTHTYLYTMNHYVMKNCKCVCWKILLMRKWVYFELRQYITVRILTYVFTHISKFSIYVYKYCTKDEIKFDSDMCVQTESINIPFLDWCNIFYVRVKIDLHMPINMRLTALCLQRERFVW